jgi:hypothetical protein
MVIGAEYVVEGVQVELPVQKKVVAGSFTARVTVCALVYVPPGGVAVVDGGVVSPAGAV